jgi:hypothetical protein
LHEAEKLFLTDKNKADKIWRDISGLYKDNSTYLGQVNYALDRLANRPVEPLPPLEPMEGTQEDES